MLNLTKQQRKQVTTILNADDNLQDEDDAIRVSLDFVSRMCDPNVLEAGAVFWISNDDEGNLTLEMET